MTHDEEVSRGERPAQLAPFELRLGLGLSLSLSFGPHPSRAKSGRKLASSNSDHNEGDESPTLQSATIQPQPRASNKNNSSNRSNNNNNNNRAGRHCSPTVVRHHCFGAGRTRPQAEATSRTAKVKKWPITVCNMISSRSGAPAAAAPASSRSPLAQGLALSSMVALVLLAIAALLVGGHKLADGQQQQHQLRKQLDFRDNRTATPTPTLRRRSENDNQMTATHNDDNDDQHQAQPMLDAERRLIAGQPAHSLTPERPQSSAQLDQTANNIAPHLANHWTGALGRQHGAAQSQIRLTKRSISWPHLGLASGSGSANVASDSSKPSDIQQQQRHHDEQSLKPPADSSRVVAISGQWLELACPLASELLAVASGQSGRPTSGAAAAAASSSDLDDGRAIVWLKDGQLLNQMNPRLRIQANGSLVIPRAEAKLDEANYECHLVGKRSGAQAGRAQDQDQEQDQEQEQGAGEQDDRRPVAPIKVHRFQLRLIVPPRLAPFEFPADAQVGMKALLTCSALEGQQPISFVWLKDNQIILPSSAASSSAASLPAPGSSPPHGHQQQPSAPTGASSNLSNKQQQQAPTLGQIHEQQLADKFALSAAAAAVAPPSSAASSLGHTITPLGDLIGAGDPIKSDVYVLIGGNNDNGNNNNHNNNQGLISSSLSDASIRIKQADDYSILSIDPLELKHSGRYTCSAQNEASRVSHSSQLTINAPPTLILEPRDGDLVSGQSTVIECQAAGQPRPTISWLRARESSSRQQWDYVPIYENLRFGPLPNGSLAITNVTQREQGYYMCAARNGFGPEVTKLIKITVHEPARIATRYKTVEARVDERALLVCQATGEPPISLQWFDREGKPIARDDKRFIIDDQTDDGSSAAKAAPKRTPAAHATTTTTTSAASTASATVESRLIIARSGRPDSGHYTCQARNRFGLDKMAVQLLVQDVPDKVLELKVTNVTASTISLRWQHPFTGNSPVTSYLVQYQSDDPLDDLIGTTANTMGPATPSTNNSTPGTAADSTSNGQLQSVASLRAALEALQAASRAGPAGGSSSTSSTPAAGSSPPTSSTLLELASSSSNLALEAIDRTLMELTVEQSSTHLVVKDLSPFCVYRLRLAGINKLGLGEFSDWIRAQTDESAPSGSALKISAAATGPNSIKLTWFPPDRRSWNGQLVRFNIGYRPLDSMFEHNKSVEWSPPTLQSIIGATGPDYPADKQQRQPQLLAFRGQQQQQLVGPTNATTDSNGKHLQPANNDQQQQQQANNNNNNNNNNLLRQHLRQLLALQQQELVAHLTNLQRSTTYLIWIQAVNKRGPGPQSHAITVKTLDDVPPSAPLIRVQSATQSSITISWSMLSNFVSPANQYSLFYRRVPPPTPPPLATTATASHQQQPSINSTTTTTAGSPFQPQSFSLGDPSSVSLLQAGLNSEPGPFIERTITSQQLAQPSGHHLVDTQQQLQQQLHFQHQQFVYTLDQLDCGSVYELYMTTRNSVGKSEPSPVVTTRTRGEPPLAPPDKSALFVRIGAQEALLNLAAWSTGGCPVTHINVRYKPVPAPVAAPSTNATGALVEATSGSSASSSMVPSSTWPVSTSVPASLLASINGQQSVMTGGGKLLAGSSAAHLLAGDLTGAASHQHRFGADPHQSEQHRQAMAPFSLKNLQPATGYELEIAAFNGAGHTTAQYEFVTGTLNGSRNGYTRREGVYRLDQRGQPLLESSSSFVARNEQQAPYVDQPTGSLSNQLLVPLALTVVCFVCLVISSTFCYYKLTDTWKRRQQHQQQARRCNSSSDDDDDPNHSPAGQTVNGLRDRACNHPHHHHHHPHQQHQHHQLLQRPNLSPSSTIDTNSKTLNWRRAGGGGIGNGNGPASHHSFTMKRPHQHQQQHRLLAAPSELMADDQQSTLTSAADSPGPAGTQVHYCSRDDELAAGDHQLLGGSLSKQPAGFKQQQQSSSSSAGHFTQSVSMKDFNLMVGGPLGAANTLNLKPSALRGSAAAAAAGHLKAGHHHTMARGRLFSHEMATSLDQQQHQQPASSNYISCPPPLGAYGATLATAGHQQRPAGQAANLGTLRHQQPSYGPASNYPADQSAYVSPMSYQTGEGNEQHETSWTTTTTTGPAGSGGAPQHQQNGTNYAIPSNQLYQQQQQQLVAAGQDSQPTTNMLGPYEAPSQQQQQQQQAIYAHHQQQQHEETNDCVGGPGSIDACIHQLMGQQQQQQYQADQQQQQLQSNATQYAILVNQQQQHHHHHNQQPTGSASNRCSLYAADQNGGPAIQSQCALGSIGAQSAIDSSSSTTSGIGTNSTATTGSSLAMSGHHSDHCVGGPMQAYNNHQQLCDEQQQQQLQ